MQRGGRRFDPGTLHFPQSGICGSRFLTRRPLKGRFAPGLDLSEVLVLAKTPEGSLRSRARPVEGDGSRATRRRSELHERTLSFATRLGCVLQGRYDAGPHAIEINPSQPRRSRTLEREELKRLTALASTSPVEFGSETRRLALEAYDARDWQGIYDWTKSWITSGGGGWFVDAWLLYVVSALLHGQPRTAVHSVDMALRTWIEAPEDRALLLWVRAAVVHRRLRDPKTAQADYTGADERAPSWLRQRVDRDAVECAADAATSRKRKPRSHQLRSSSHETAASWHHPWPGASPALCRPCGLNFSNR